MRTLCRDAMVFSIDSQSKWTGREYARLMNGHRGRLAMICNRAAGRPAKVPKQGTNTSNMCVCVCVCVFVMIGD